MNPLFLRSFLFFTSGRTASASKYIVRVIDRVHSFETQLTSKVHWNGFSPVCTSWCLLSLLDSTNALPHSPQIWTLGPWVWRCFRIAAVSRKAFPQPSCGQTTHRTGPPGPELLEIDWPLFWCWLWCGWWWVVVELPVFGPPVGDVVILTTDEAPDGEVVISGATRRWVIDGGEKRRRVTVPGGFVAEFPEVPWGFEMVTTCQPEWDFRGLTSPVVVRSVAWDVRVGDL